MYFLQQNYLMDFNSAYDISRQGIKTAKYITTTFASSSTTYLFNAPLLMVLSFLEGEAISSRENNYKQPPLPYFSPPNPEINRNTTHWSFYKIKTKPFLSSDRMYGNGRTVGCSDFNNSIFLKV